MKGFSALMISHEQIQMVYHKSQNLTGCKLFKAQTNFKRTAFVFNSNPTIKELGAYEPL